MSLKNEMAFDWIKTLPPELNRKFLVKIVAKYPGTTDHTKDPTNSDPAHPIRIYTEEELAEAARSLSFRLIDVDHNLNEIIPGAYVGEAEWHEGKLECWAYIPSQEWIDKIKSGFVKGVSVETYNREDIPSGNKITLKGIIFTGLGLVTGNARPGDPNTSIQPMYESLKDHMYFEIASFEPAIPEVKVEMVVQRGSQWCVIHCHGPESGSAIKCFDTKDQADAMHAAIQNSKSSKESLEEPIKVEAVKEPVKEDVIEDPKDKKIKDLEIAVDKLQKSVEKVELSVQTKVNEAKKEGIKEVVEKLKNIIPPEDIKFRFNYGAQRFTEEVKKVVRESK